MKLFIPCVLAAALGSGLLASSRTAAHAAPAAPKLVRAVDDPPPEPVECPFCGGNAQLHAKRLVVIEMRMNVVALLATRW